jgi:hypothetical protein
MRTEVRDHQPIVTGDLTLQVSLPAEMGAGKANSSNTSVLAVCCAVGQKELVANPFPLLTRPISSTPQLPRAA